MYNIRHGILAIPDEVRRKHGVSRKYNKRQSYIYFWKARWNEMPESLACQSRRAHSHPHQHTAAEMKLIRNMRRHTPNLGIVGL